MQRMYSIFDVKAVLYSYPFQAPNNAVAIRLFKQAANDPQSHISQNPEDYLLVYVGDFDESSGQLTAPDDVTLLGAASAYKERIN